MVSITLAQREPVTLKSPTPLRHPMPVSFPFLYVKCQDLIPKTAVWHLLEHMRIAQKDILEFVLNPDYQSPRFPDGYWPRADEKASPEQWEKTINDFLADLKAMGKWVKDPQADFFGPLPRAKEYTVFREVLLGADHNAYHLGELVGLRRVLNLTRIQEY